MEPTFTFPDGLAIHRLGYGAMRLRDNPGNAPALLHRAIELGVNFIDTAEGYGPSEVLMSANL